MADEASHNVKSGMVVVDVPWPLEGAGRVEPAEAADGETCSVAEHLFVGQQEALRDSAEESSCQDSFSLVLLRAQPLLHAFLLLEPLQARELKTNSLV